MPLHPRRRLWPSTKLYPSANSPDGGELRRDLEFRWAEIWLPLPLKAARNLVLFVQKSARNFQKILTMSGIFPNITVCHRSNAAPSELGSS